MPMVSESELMPSSSTLLTVPTPGSSPPASMEFNANSMASRRSYAADIVMGHPLDASHTSSISNCAALPCSSTIAIDTDHSMAHLCDSKLPHLPASEGKLFASILDSPQASSELQTLASESPECFRGPCLPYPPQVNASSMSPALKPLHQKCSRRNSSRSGTKSLPEREPLSLDSPALGESLTTPCSASVTRSAQHRQEQNDFIGRSTSASPTLMSTAERLTTWVSQAVSTVRHLGKAHSHEFDGATTFARLVTNRDLVESTSDILHTLNKLQGCSYEGESRGNHDDYDDVPGSKSALLPDAAMDADLPARQTSQGNSTCLFCSLNLLSH
jgi:hypothetical protein